MGMVLEGIKVIDMSQYFAGPGTAMYLADLGADVIKVEPLAGDSCRTLHTTPRLGPLSKPFLVLNRNKRSIAMDIRKPKAMDVLFRLLDKADVLIHNFVVGDDVKFGLDYPTVSKRNPRLVYAHVTAYGTTGPHAKMPGYDIAIQARLGITGARRMPDGTPVSSPVLVADMSAPMLLSFGITAALLDRYRTGRGRLVETSLLDLIVAMQGYTLVKGEGDDPTLPGSQSNVQYSPYRCADDKWLVAAFVSDQKWVKICEVLDLAHLATDPAYDNYMKRVAASAEIGAVFQEIFMTKPRDEWIRLLEAAEVPCCPVNDREDVFDDPQVRAVEAIIPYDHPRAGRVWFMNTPLQISGQERRVRLPAPLVGEQTDAILKEAGYAATEIAALRKEKAVA